MVYYLLITCSALLFSLQFIFNQRFQKEYGTGTEATHVFLFYRSVVIMILMFVINGFTIQITGFSLILAIISSVVNIGFQYYSLKAFEVVNLSVYSVFTMLGGMLLPFLVGILFYQEELSVFKLICCGLIVVAILINVKSGKQDKKAIIYYIIVFVLNGLVGVISKVHQSSLVSHVDSASFTFLSSLVIVVVSGACLLWKNKKIPIPSGKCMFHIAGFGAFNGLGNWIMLIALMHLPASVQFPLVTGGTMVFSTLISMVRKEKIRKADYFSAIIAFVASVMMAF